METYEFERKLLMADKNLTLMKILLMNEMTRTLLYRWFIRLGTLFYEVVAVHQNGKTVHFGTSELSMVDSMISYLDDDEFITRPKDK